MSRKETQNLVGQRKINNNLVGQRWRTVRSGPGLCDLFGPHNAIGGREEGVPNVLVLRVDGRHLVADEKTREAARSWSKKGSQSATDRGVRAPDQH